MGLRGHNLAVCLVAGASMVALVESGCGRRSEESAPTSTMSEDDRSGTQGSPIRLEEGQTAESPTPIGHGTSSEGSDNASTDGVVEGNSTNRLGGPGRANTAQGPLSSHPTPPLPESPSKSPNDGVIGHRPPMLPQSGRGGSPASSLGDNPSLTSSDARTLRAMLQAQQAQCSTLRSEYRRVKSSGSTGTEVDTMTREVARCEAMLVRIQQRMRAVGVSEN